MHVMLYGHELGWAFLTTSLGQGKASSESAQIRPDAMQQKQPRRSPIVWSQPVRTHMNLVVTMQLCDDTATVYQMARISKLCNSTCMYTNLLTLDICSQRPVVCIFISLCDWLLTTSDSYVLSDYVRNQKQAARCKCDKTPFITKQCFKVRN